MLSQTLVLAFIVFASCGHDDRADNILRIKTTVTTDSKKYYKVENALAFINAYAENSNKLNKSVGTIEWVNSNTLTTKSFKAELRRVIDDAYAKDPEYGLGADPIFDAQDNPDEGFELESFDENANYLIVKGKDWPEFKLTMKVIEENGEWLVDGCGMVNIPNNRRAER